MKRFFQTVLFLLIWGLLLGGGYVFYEAHRFLNSPASAKAEEVIFSIAPGATFDRVAWDLKKAGIITDVPRFRLYARYHDALGKVRAGEYLLSTGWTPEQVLFQITQGQAMLYRLSIREGLTWWETAKAVEEQGFARFDDFKEVIHDPAFLREHSIPFANAEGFLYPETYLLKKPRSPLDKQQAREVADIMVRMFWKKTEPLWRQMPKIAGAGGEAGALGVPVLPRVPGAMSSETGGAPGKAEAPAPKAAEASANGTSGLPPVPESPALATAGVRPAEAAPVETAPAVSPAPGAETQIPQADRNAAQAPAESAGAAPGGLYRGNATTATLAAPENSEAPAQPQESRAAPETAEAEQAAPPPRPGVNATAPAPEAPRKARENPAEIEPKAIQHLVILASLVEKETGLPEERGKVAGVYANRLRLNMLLQCDPTIIYGVGPDFSGAIRRSQLDDEKNPYNTYQHPGLPPGPICSSGFASLQAAFAPEKHDFLYFVATGVDAGHVFSKNLADHNKAVQIYRARMRDANKK